MSTRRAVGGAVVLLSITAIAVVSFSSTGTAFVDRKITPYDTTAAVLFICWAVASALVKGVMVLDYRYPAINLTAVLIWVVFFLVNWIKVASAGGFVATEFSFREFAGLFVLIGWPCIDLFDWVYLICSQQKEAAA